ncbi:leucine-rich repeat LGI family member 4-like [Serinus canaria]|uniref:leucine-rich repeat LGI family member 4-like n=1 Tax=Serinus canaria TaxID=9135 RepID=UPI0021CCBC08|nr:leucine-rich repeat LGI family member 4-like [Serinus canaria]
MSPWCRFGATLVPFSAPLSPPSPRGATLVPFLATPVPFLSLWCHSGAPFRPPVPPRCPWVSLGVPGCPWVPGDARWCHSGAIWCHLVPFLSLWCHSGAPFRPPVVSLGVPGCPWVSLGVPGCPWVPGGARWWRRDLRGNPLRCDCALRWLLAWLGTRPSPPEGRCREPLPHLGTALAQLSPRELQCHRDELRPFQSLPFQSLGAAPFALGGHPGVALAQPLAGACALLEWDQLGGRFRAQSVVNASSPVACHPIPLGDTLLLVVAQLGGGSWVWRRSGGPGSPFVRHQALGQGHLRRPHAVTSAHLGGHLYLAVADSSKGGTSTVFRWASRAFYPHQALRPWRRDTHLEFLELGGRAALVVCSAARRPQVYRWSGSAFAPHTDIPHAPDAYAAKHFRAGGGDGGGGVFLCVTRFLGDAKVMRWEGSMFREVQAVPARGSLVFQPLLLAGQRFVLLGNDFAPSRVFRPGAGGRLEPVQELPAPSPRAFVPLRAGQRHFLLATSFKGATQIYALVSEDVGT